MKSIMEQASSIIKAIEKAWISADKPKEFSVKIFEKEEKNFFGMTTKQAKIGIFFSDKPYSSHEKTGQKSPHADAVKVQQAKPSSKPQQSNPQPQKQAASTNTHKPQQQARTEKPKVETQPAQPKQPRVSAAWNDTMINSVSSWINKTLELSSIKQTAFSSEIAGKVLKITFEKPLIENPATEKQLFRSVAHLIMSSLRNQYKQEIKDLKIVLIRPQ